MPEQNLSICGRTRQAATWSLTLMENVCHPFTAMVCGDTQRGKTCFVQKALEHNQDIICPPPTRIMWCYGSYQTVYDEMLKTVKPTTEFLKGCLMT